MESKETYEAVARELHAARLQIGYDVRDEKSRTAALKVITVLSVNLAGYFARNPRFNVGKFLDAAGVPERTASAVARGGES